MGDKVRHPAKYNDDFLPVFSEYILPGSSVLDPFGGVGKIFDLRKYCPDLDIYCVEIEKEWAEQHEDTIHGDFFKVNLPYNFFDAVVTSPCLTPDQRILAADLRWVPAGDIVAGDKLIAFDEFGVRVKENGQASRRRLRIATVTEAAPARKRCVRVILENGEPVTCTYDHPWLVTLYTDNSRGAEWVQAKDLMGLCDPHVLRQFDVNGGFYEIFRVLGELHPKRLLDKVSELEVEARCTQPSKVRVVAVEDIGERPIAGITTSTGTYIGEGYLMHNTYGNRMADHHNARDKSRRNTYRHSIGRELSSNNSGKLQWGHAYRKFHLGAWLRVHDLLRRDGILILNIKDHIRKGRVVDVSEWNKETILSIGFSLFDHREIESPGLRHGSNSKLRVDHENIYVFKKVC